jgi:hypothetical protein
MEEVRDVMKKDVKKAHKAILINVKRMEAENDVLKKDVKKAHKAVVINV